MMPGTAGPFGTESHPGRRRLQDNQVSRHKQFWIPTARRVGLSSLLGVQARCSASDANKLLVTRDADVIPAIPMKQASFRTLQAAKALE